MKLALEYPTSLLGTILDDFDFPLVHLVLSDREYAEYYRDSNRYKVLDNSVNELGKPCSLLEIQEAAKIVKPDLIVPPDFLFDDHATVISLLHAICMFSRDRILPVIQGKDIQSALRCARVISRRGFDRIAVPYRIASSFQAPREEMKEIRSSVVKAISDMFNSIHLFGITTLEELRLYKDLPVESLDTGAPIILGLQGIRFGRDELPEKVTPTLSLKYSLDSINWEAIRHNVSYLRSLMC